MDLELWIPTSGQNDTSKNSLLIRHNNYHSKIHEEILQSKTNNVLPNLIKRPFSIGVLMDNRFYFVLGDWSDDGHGKTEKILIESSHSVKEVQNAYKKSCKLTGISFNHNEDFTGRKRDYSEEKLYHVCAEYEQSQLSEEIFKCFLKLHKEGHPCKVLNQMEKNKRDGLYLHKDTFLDLFFWFVGLSLKDFKYKKIENEYPVLNGYWDKNLNVQFGYGLYS